MTKPIRKIAFNLDLPEYIRIHLIIYVSHTTPYLEHPQHISAQVTALPAPVSLVEGEEHVLEKLEVLQKEAGDGST